MSQLVPNQKHAVPFLRWAGGKRKLMSEILASLPDDFGHQGMKFFEPFIGGGALMFELGKFNSKYFVEGKNLHIGDSNPDLIATYKVIRDNPKELIAKLRKLENRISLEDYLNMRALQPEKPIDVAARFIYLNKTCFNGLWRVNSSGQFNVPYGKLKNPKVLDKENLILCSKRLANSKIKSGDFEAIVKSAEKGDFVYFDPPYLPLSESASFSKYAKEDFSTLDHERLANTIAQLTKRGVKVMLSNSDTKLTRAIFKNDLRLRKVSVARTIAANSRNRTAVDEIIGTNY